MSKLSPETARILYLHLAEVRDESHSTPKEKIPKIRSILEKMFRELTEQVDWLFTDLLERMLYVQDTLRPPEELTKQLHQFRAYANRVTHEYEFLPTPAECAACFQLVGRAIRFFSDVSDENSVLEEPETPYSGFKWRLPKERDKIAYLDLRIQRVSEVRQSAGDKPHGSFDVLGFSPVYGKVKLMVRDTGETQPGGELSKLAPLLRPYALIRVFQVRRALDKPDFFLTERQSYVVLEPDYLISVSATAAAFEGETVNAGTQIVDAFIENPVKLALTKGAIVNRLMDDLLQNPLENFDELYQKALNANALELTEALTTEPRAQTNEQTLWELKAEVRRQTEVVFRFVQTIQNKKVLVEPTFYSTLHGLQGRLDLLIEDDAAGEHLSIVELKSGKAPDLFAQNPVRTEHEAQAQAYILLANSVYAESVITASIFYAEADWESEPLRQIVCGSRDRQALMWARTEMAAQEYAFANNDFRLLDALIENAGASWPRLRTSALNNFRGTMQDASPLEQAYFRALVGFAYRELLSAKVGGGSGSKSDGYAALWRQSASEKLDAYELLYYLRLDRENSDFDRMYLTLFKDNLLSRRISNFRAGDIALLYPVEANGMLQPLKRALLKCTIRVVEEDRVVVSLRNKQTDRRFFDQSDYWALEHDFLEQTARSLIKQPFRLLSAAERKRKLILGLTQPRFAQRIANLPPNMEPRMAYQLNRALNAQDYYLLQGPPGTGKTSVFIKEMARYLWRETRENVLILAYTNRAVDEICLQLQDLGLEFFRIGFSRNHDFPAEAKFSREKSFEEIRDYLTGCRFFVSTVSSYLSNCQKLTYKTFHTAIVDEAAQLLEPHLCGILPYVGRFILIGDEKQLPAVVRQSESGCKTNHFLLRQIGLTDLSRSLFERLLDRCKLMQWRDAFGQLNCQYRMAPPIMAVANRFFYDEQLISPPNHSYPALFSPDSADWLEHTLAQNPVVFFDFPVESQLRVHQGQAILAAKIVGLIGKNLGEKFDNQTVGVITPYRSQGAEISDRLPVNLKHATRVDTVERFQGSQRQAIIYSLPTNDESLLRNLSSITPDGKHDRKLNAALARARSNLIILGNAVILRQNYHYRRLLEYLMELNAIFSV